MSKQEFSNHFIDHYDKSIRYSSKEDIHKSFKLLDDDAAEDAELLVCLCLVDAQSLKHAWSGLTFDKYLCGDIYITDLETMCFSIGVGISIGGGRRGASHYQTGFSRLRCSSSGIASKFFKTVVKILTWRPSLE